MRNYSVLNLFVCLLKSEISFQSLILESMGWINYQGTEGQAYSFDSSCTAIYIC